MNMESVFILEASVTGERGRYKTKNHKALMSALEAAPGRCFTVDEIFDMLNARGEKIGRTTVYRQLENLAEEQIILKYIAENGESATYRLGSEGCAAHLHLKCMDCGAIIHLDCDTAEFFSRHLREDHGFTLDPSRTVIYGHCGCLTKNTQENNK